MMDWKYLHWIYREIVQVLSRYLPEVTQKSHNNTQHSPCFDKDSYRAHPDTILDFLFCGDGPRSSCYGRTAALRLIVQPCDEEKHD
jgi:hypothetical protein